MVRAVDKDEQQPPTVSRSKSNSLRKMFEIPGRQIQNMFFVDHSNNNNNNNNNNATDNDVVVEDKPPQAPPQLQHQQSIKTSTSTSTSTTPPNLPKSNSSGAERLSNVIAAAAGLGERLNETAPAVVEGSSPPEREKRVECGPPPKTPTLKEKGGPPSDLDLMKEKFGKLLLGEDMSGGGKGVSSALALSNAITNLAASVFGEQKRLEPMSADAKGRWKKEIDWLLSVTDHIVEFVPSQQSNNGVNMEIMVTRQRSDLLMNIPALRKLDTILVELLDQFGKQNEFWYVSKSDEDEKGGQGRNEDKWWIPTAKVPKNGLSEPTRRWLQSQKDAVNQVLKAAMAINALVLSEMDVPEEYIESLPKNGRSSLGDSIYKSITDEYFDPTEFLSTTDLSTEHKVLELKNRIEASIVIWKRKMVQKDGKAAWGSAVSIEKRELFEERAETILLILKHNFPGLPQSALDISKISNNMDVGQAILESYSRIIESLAYTVLSRIEDVLFADTAAQNPPPDPSEKVPAEEETDKLSSSGETPSSMTLSDFMGWSMEKGESTTELKKSASSGNIEGLEQQDKGSVKAVATPRKSSYLERLENLSGLRSPTARH
ncbi:Rho guanine nucleotide exchange factor 8 [Linum grandiflorum]